MNLDKYRHYGGHITSGTANLFRRAPRPSVMDASAPDKGQIKGETVIMILSDKPEPYCAEATGRESTVRVERDPRGFSADGNVRLGVTQKFINFKKETSL